MDIKDFALRLSTLRINKGVSARDMSLSLGQSPGYINNIETCVNYPSMSMFFCICEYLEITPAQFFDVESKDPKKDEQLLSEIKGLSGKQSEHILAIIKDMKK